MVLRVVVPLVPVMVTVCDPVGAPDTVTVTTEEAVPPAGGVTGLVPNTRFKPPGAPELVKVTGAENIPTDCTAIVEVPDVPGPRDSEDGVAVIV